MQLSRSPCPLQVTAVSGRAGSGSPGGGEVVFLGAHGGALAPEELPAEAVADEAGGQLVAVARAAPRHRHLPQSEFLSD